MLKSFLCLILVYGTQTHGSTVYDGRLPWGSGLAGSKVVIKGTPNGDAERFDVNACESGNSCSLHFNPRFLYKYVILNSKKKKVWGSAQKVNKMPFAKGKDFTMTIIYADDGFEISVNNQTFVTFAHRAPKESNINIVVKGSVEISDVEYSCIPDSQCEFSIVKSELQFVDVQAPFYTSDDGDDWTIVQRRTSGEQDFYKDWQDYVSGFGQLAGDFWYGLENIHQLCKVTGCELRVDIHFDEEEFHEKYSNFSLSGIEENYKLSVGGSEGDAGDSLSYHNGRPFSAYDNDNDEWSGNCAETYHGGWWYGRCLSSNLNAEWQSATRYNGVLWRTLMEPEESASWAQMLVRPYGSTLM